MKKHLNFIFAFATMLFIALQAFVVLNMVYLFVDFTEYLGLISKISTYGPIVLMGGFMLINITGKGVLRVISSIIAVVALVAYILVVFFPTFTFNLLPF